MKIVAIMGKSASGKDTLAGHLKRINTNLNAIVSCTTRPKRDYETNGIDYHFYTNEEMAEKVFNGDMLECTVFNDWVYGTSIQSLDKDKINIGVFNPEGVESLREAGLDVYCIYVECNDKERLIRSLNREVNPDVDEIVRRYGTDAKDFKYAEEIADIIAYTDIAQPETLALRIDELIEDWAK